MSITSFILENEATIRIISFAAVLGIMAFWEMIAPKRALTVSKGLRWFNNLGITFLNTALLRFIFPAAAIGVAAYAAEHGWGLFNAFDIPAAIAIIATIILMDLIIYLQHIIAHIVPIFWRLHRVHHADVDYDVTTGSRFHPIEILLSLLVKFATIILLGAPVVAVIIFEVMLNGMAMFNHSNIGLPKKLDRIVRWFVVTPDMHRIHHSTIRQETDSNYGFNLSIWDRLFRTYTDKPSLGEEGLIIGIKEFREQKDVVWITGLLALPFKATPQRQQSTHMPSAMNDDIT